MLTDYMDYLLDIINGVIEWSNSNTGFLMALLTAVYVIATILILYESRRNNRLMISFERDRNRPHVVFWVESEMETQDQYFSTIGFVGKIRNEGASTAHNVKITTEPKLIARQGVGAGGKDIYRTPTFLEEKTSILVPNQTISEDIGPTEFLLKDNDDKELLFKVSIECSDVDGQVYSTEYNIDLSRNKNRIYTEDSKSKAYFSLVEKVSVAAESLERINTTLNQPDRSNIYIRENLVLNDKQKALLEYITKLEKDTDTNGNSWFLSEVIGKTSIRRAIDEVELEVETQDIQTLCRAGYLRGYYSDSTLWFYTAPSVKNA